MARSISEIYDEMNSEKQSMASLTSLAPSVNDAQTLLTDLNSPSKVANWRLFMWVIAFGIWVFEKLNDLFKEEVEAIIAKFRPGTLRWYQEQAFLFQYGHELTWNATERKYEYATVDAAAKIVKYCSVAKVGNIVRIKVAADDGNGNPVALTTPQLAALNAFYFMWGYPVQFVCVSYNADELKIYGIVKYNPMVDTVATQALVESAINTYLKSLPFNGRFNINQLIDKVQTLTGVEDFTQVQVWTKYGALAYQSVTDEYQTYAGYAKIDSVNFPLSTTLTYQPYV